MAWISDGLPRGFAMEMTLGSSFARSARKYASKVAIADDQRRLTYQQLNHRVNRLANAMLEMQIDKGQRAAVLSSNCTHLMEIYLAHLKLGVVTVPLTVRETAEGIIRQARLSCPRLLLFHVRLTEMAERLLMEVPCIEKALAFGGSSPEFALDLETLIEQGSSAEPPDRVREADDAFIMFTGGTTGAPKGAVLTHKNLLWNAICKIAENRSPSPQDIIYYPMQMYHSAAMSRFLAYMYAGGTFIGSPSFDPERYLAMVERERATAIVGNSTIWKMLLEIQRTRPFDTSSIRNWVHSQGPLDPALREEVRGLLFPRAEGFVTYALTEASPGVTILKPEDRPRHWSSVGRPYMCTEVRIAAPGEDRPLAPGEVGEIQVRGPTVMKGYFNDPEGTEEALKGGWLHTGDLGRQDELGYLYVVDRLKDMIKTGGLNVYSREVEEVLLSHPDVEEAAVIGVPDDRWGETVRAIVVGRRGSDLTEEALVAYCKGRLEGYKRPTSVVFVQELPRGSSGGKVLKRVLRELYGTASTHCLEGRKEESQGSRERKTEVRR